MRWKCIATPSPRRTHHSRDDLIATGGTAEAAVKLLRSLGAQILAACFIIDLPELGGSRALPPCRCRSGRLLPLRDTDERPPVRRLLFVFQ